MWKIATLRSSSGLPKAPSSVDLAAELLALKPAVIVAGSPQRHWLSKSKRA
jgi:hypothetical protein